MPRAERPLEDDGSALSQFASDLRALRRRAGSPTYRELASRAHFSSTTLSDAAGGRQFPSLAVTIAYVRACGGDADQWEQRWHTLAAEWAIQRPVRDEDAEAPYVGLAAYSEADAARFFGRERLIADLDHRITHQRFLAVFGPSGSGKSSVLRAGLVPRLINANAGPVVVLHPGASPVTELATHLAELLGTTPDDVTHELAPGGAEALRALSDRILQNRPDASEIVLVVDQFEEIFTLCDDKDERTLFITLLTDTARHHGHLRVVLGVRADFYDHCAQDPELAAALQDAQVTVGPMTVDELRLAITKPAVNANCTIETALLATLIAQAQGQAGVLPLLSHALLETWRHRKGHTLTLAGFHSTGGIAGALANSAESVFTDFSGPQQAFTAQLFRRLTAVGEDTADTKRRINLDELDDNQDTRSVLAALVSARLIMISQNTVEITHEALINGWPRLYDWLQEDRDGQRLHRMLTEATATWITHNEEPGSLLRGARLEMVSGQAVRNAQLSAKEREFLDASISAHEHEKRVSRRRSRRQRQLIALLATILMLSVAATIYAVDSRRTATRQRNIALALSATRAATEISPNNPSLAAQISLAAFRLHSSQATKDGVITAAAEATKRPLEGDIDRVSLSADGDIAIAVTTSGDVSIWRVTDGGATRESELRGAQLDAEISTNGRLIETVDGDGKMRLWDTADPKSPRLAASLPGLAVKGSISPTGRSLIVVGGVPDPELADNSAGSLKVGSSKEGRLWNISDPGNPIPEGKTVLAGCQFAFSADDAYIIGNSCYPKPTSDGSENTLYPVRAGMIGPGRIFGAPGRDVFGPIISRNGRILAGTVGGGSGAAEILLWEASDLASPKLAGSVQPPSVGIDSIALNGTGDKLAFAGPATIQIRDISDARNPRKTLDLLSVRARFSSLKFAPDDRVIIGVGRMESDGTYFVWRWNSDASLAANAICAQPVKTITQAEWETYFPELSYQPPCS
ncbi:hypothetical protein DMH01_15300 [Amycolatopsis sp. WAC 04182]|uniref:nSTAND1 domain-containing NTPase n=1 Tax=Amycolatopsis sp. WAC 04182 TaxID=2203198 RepID=UPI000F77F8F6|nr:helix-turn-helix domain-containing protein [Amycolatopsis sp. WAC 04182]RSN60654.1 hypothetical protein DMH01_15300 [Amycolatopsis sp. WAC 04182]